MNCPLEDLPLDGYRRELAAEIEAIKVTPRQDGMDEIRIPGARAYRESAEREGQWYRDRPADLRRLDRAGDACVATARRWNVYAGRPSRAITRGLYGYARLL